MSASVNEYVWILLSAKPLSFGKRAAPEHGFMIPALNFDLLVLMTGSRLLGVFLLTVTSTSWFPDTIQSAV